MAFDLTVVLTSAVTGVAGYGGARLQGRVALAQSRAQTEQATADRDLTALEKRQVAYHDLLDAIRQLQLLVYGSSALSASDFAEWNGGYQHLLNGVGLLGVEAVRDAARRFDEVLRTLADRVPEHSDSFQSGMQAGYNLIEGEITTRFRELMDGMSADVAPAQPSRPMPPRGWKRLAGNIRLIKSKSAS
jgi:hypothetical protein